MLHDAVIIIRFVIHGYFITRDTLIMSYINSLNAYSKKCTVRTVLADYKIPFLFEYTTGTEVNQVKHNQYYICSYLYCIIQPNCDVSVLVIAPECPITNTVTYFAARLQCILVLPYSFTCMHTNSKHEKIIAAVQSTFPFEIDTSQGTKC